MATDFRAAFDALTGNTPFPWQERLFDRMVAGDLPAACDIPTGLGKTSVMAIWLIARAFADDTALRQIPRRLVYVVDRRAVVDQATAEAEKILAGLKRVPDLVAKLGLTKAELPISTLRGQHVDNRDWLIDPSMPAIVVGTVDMVGSRLLWQGYNVSNWMRPLHAAMLGTDALIVLDEAHLVPPFQALVERVGRLTAPFREKAPYQTPLRLLTLTATGRERPDRAAFTLLPDTEAEGEIAARRLGARKLLRLEPPVAGPAALAVALAERAWERGSGGKRVIVFCNSRNVAKSVADDLSGRLKAMLGKGGNPADHVDLVVGARRVRERERLVENPAFKRFVSRKTETIDSPTPAESVAPKPAFLVATSAGEVGVDIDAEHMVGDLVAWERMVQRLGRVNRLGEAVEPALVDVFPAISEKDKDAEVVIESEQLKLWRKPFESADWPQREDGRRDASPGELRRLRDIPEFRREAEAATTEEPLRPDLNLALVDAFAMTSIDEHPGRPDLQPWIRGWVDDEPQTRAFWRRLLPVRTGEPVRYAKARLNAFFEVAPPDLSELLETLSRDIGKLVRDRAKAIQKEVEKRKKRGADPETVNDLPREDEWVAAILKPNRKVENTLTLEALAEVDDRDLFGRMLVLDARLGGLSEEGLLDAKVSNQPSTLDESGVVTPAIDGAFTLVWDEARLREVGFRVRRVPHSERSEDDWEEAESWFVDRMAEETADAGSSAEEWRIEVWVRKRPSEEEPAQANRKQGLDEHHAAAEKWAGYICGRLGLPGDLTELIVKCAGVHDLGKGRKNWQAYAGNYGYRPGQPSALAKFTTRGDPRLLRIGEESYRHEFGSLHDVIKAKTFAHLDEEMRDLALHLILAHHGRGRPVAAAVDELHLNARSAVLARDAALRFGRLQRHWGAWNLAWLEAILRAADVNASRNPEGPPCEPTEAR